MNYIFISSDGHGMPIAYRLQEEGNEVWVGMVNDLSRLGKKNDSGEEKKRRLSLYDNMIHNKIDADKLVEMASKIKNKDEWFVLCDFNNLYYYADKFKSMGFKGLLPTKEDYELEEDRMKAKKLVEKLFPDLDVAECHEFKTIDEAKQFLETTEEMFVLKGFNGDCKTIVPEKDDVSINHLEIIDALDAGKQLYEEEGFMLEEKIPDLIEFTPECFSYDGKVLGFAIDIEAKDIGAGETGFQTGCSFDLIVWSDNEELYNKFLKPLEKMMLRKNEMTIWDAAVAYSPSRKKYYFLEFCFNRWGFNSVFNEINTFPSATAYFERIINKENLYQPDVKKFGSSVRIFNILPDKDHKEMVVKDSFLWAENKKEIWLWDIKKKDDNFYTAGVDKNLAVITGSGNTPKQSANKAYDNLDKYFSWTGGLFRDKKDYLSKDYDVSLLNRLEVIKKLLKLA
jgi:hypothetical protein